MIVAVAILGGCAAALFARLCDAAMHLQGRIAHAFPLLALVLLPVSFAAAAWLTGRLAPEAAGSGIP